MRQARWNPRVLGPGAVLLALLGTWAGHTLEVLRFEAATRASLASLHVPPTVAQGLTRAYSIAPFGGVHNYMAALGAVLLIASGLGSLTLVQAWTSLTRRFENARMALRLLFRNRMAGTPGTPIEISLPTRFLATWVPLTGLQIALYLLQENIEATASGLPAPGLSALTGLHWAAPWIHAAVAFVLTAGVLALSRTFRERVLTVRTAERTVRSRQRLLRRAIAPARFTASSHTPSIADVLGWNVWRRPPPAAAVSI